jgi:ATP-dependent RNA helicase DeaD
MPKRPNDRPNEDGPKPKFNPGGPRPKFNFGAPKPKFNPDRPKFNPDAPRAKFNPDAPKGARPKPYPNKGAKQKAAALVMQADIAPEEPEVLAELPMFNELGLSEPIVRAITDLGFEAPTPIQARAIPILLTGRDMIGQAQTGTGKTAAFALPIIERCDPALHEVQAIILEPTRELAIQVAGGVYDLGKHTGLRVVPVYGGQPLDRQFRALRAGAHIVVGTPGRVLDHLRRGTLSLASVKVCVLDEADEMLALGFLEEVETILSELPEVRQMAFFSATMAPRVLDLTKRFLKDPVRVSIQSKQRTLDTTRQSYYDVQPGKKMEALARVLDMETPGPTIVFCKTRLETTELADNLRLRGYVADALNGEMSQQERDRVMKRFREGQSDLLIATDVAARGLDIDTVTHVINYAIPWDIEQYIHRIGRTGRAGREGDAITLVEGRERRQLQLIEKMIGATIKPVRLPTAADIAARRRDVFKDTLRKALEVGDFDGHMDTVEALSTDFNPTQIAAAALHMLWQERHNSQNELSSQEIEADGERPESGMVRLFIGMGRQDGLRPGDLVGAISNEAGISGRSIGTIEILDRASFVEVPSDEARNVVNALRNTQIRGKKPKIEVAQPAGNR